MEELITFEPLGLNNTFNWIIAGLVICVGLLIYAWANKYKILLLVAGLGIFTLGTSAYFSWFTIQKVQKITIGDDYIETLYGKLNFDEIAKISMDRRIISPFGEVTDTNNVELYLILEPIDRTKQLTVLSEQTFDIKAIKVALEEKIQAWKE